jgi:HAMP domain-containing protein
MNILMRSLSTKIVGATAAVLVVLLGATTWFEYASRRQEMVRMLREESAQTTATLDATLRHAMMIADGEALDNLVLRVGGMKAIRSVSLLSEDGTVARASVAAQVGQAGPKDDLAAIRASKQSVTRLVRTPDGHSFIQVLSPIAAEEGCLSCHSGLKTGEAAGFLALERWTDADLKQLQAGQTRLLLMNLGLLLSVLTVLVFVSRAIIRPVRAMAGVASRLAQGDIEQQVDYHSEDEVGQLADSFRAVTGYLGEMAGAARALGDGDLSLRVTPRSQKDILALTFQRSAQSIAEVVEETRGLTRAAVEGRLANRGDPSRFQGGYREIVQGINATLDAVIVPLNVAANYVDRISKGDIPAKITDDYQGDFNEIKNNLNTCIDAVNALVADAIRLSQAAVEGTLATRADATRHQGDFRTIVEGVNETLSAVIGPLNVAATYVDRISKGDIPP